MCDALLVFVSIHGHSGEALRPYTYDLLIVARPLEKGYLSSATVYSRLLVDSSQRMLCAYKYSRPMLIITITLQAEFYEYNVFYHNTYIFCDMVHTWEEQKNITRLLKTAKLHLPSVQIGKHITSTTTHSSYESDVQSKIHQLLKSEALKCDCVNAGCGVRWLSSLTATLAGWQIHVDFRLIVPIAQTTTRIFGRVKPLDCNHTHKTLTFSANLCMARPICLSDKPVASSPRSSRLTGLVGGHASCSPNDEGYFLEEGGQNDLAATRHSMLCTDSLAPYM